MRTTAWIVLMIVSTPAHATSILDFDKWMQRIEKRALSVQKQLVKQDAAASTDDAQELITLYEQMQHYFEARSNADSAVKMSRDGRDAAAAIVTHVAGKNFDAAVTAARQLTHECRTCHRAYKPLE